MTTHNTLPQDLSDNREPLQFVMLVAFKIAERMQRARRTNRRVTGILASVRKYDRTPSKDTLENILVDALEVGLPRVSALLVVLLRQLPEEDRATVLRDALIGLSEWSVD